MKTKTLQRKGPKRSTFTSKLNYSLVIVINTLAKVPKNRQSKELNTYQTNKGNRRGVTPKQFPSKW
jgi:hypothetical protein